MHDFPLGQLQAANEYLESPQQLNARFQEDGYLFFRGVLDPVQVQTVKLDIVQILQQQGVVKPLSREPVWTGRGVDCIDDTPLYALDSCNRLLESSQIRAATERAFGEPVYMYRNINIRFSLPEDEAYLTPAHQDHFFIRETAKFRTAWVPLMEIDRTVGGLALGRGSHRLGLLEHVQDPVARSYIFRGRQQRGIPMERIAGDWLTAAFAPGDLLLFHSLMVHRALPNRSDKIRLSLDVRFQPKSIPLTWQAQKTIPELREYRSRVQQIATEEGAGEDLFERVLIEMMKRGSAAELNQVRALMAELQAGCRAVRRPTAP